ncbi:MAG: hypothetical protein HQM02_10725 [Magnetococcales bacterium]|nr:hypothetical protein [Magnetococcales bacterium]
MMPKLRFVMVCAMGVLLTACGGGGSGSSKSSSSSTSGTATVADAPVTGSGIFQGSTVVGVHYRAELNGQVKEGETDAEGKFQFISMGGVISPVTFSVGGVTLGTVTPSTVSGAYTMNVVDLVDTKDADASTKALNIQRFLNTINTSGNDGVIQVSSAVRKALNGESVKLNEVSVGDFEAQANALVGTLVSASARPSGTTLVSANAVKSHMQETKSQIDAMRVATFEITTGADSVLADGKSQVLIRVQATKLGGGNLTGGLVQFQTTAGTLGSESNLCDPATTATTSVDKVTDASGMAHVMLTPRCQTASAVVSVSLGGKIIFKTIQFSAASAASANSTLTVSPKSLAADGRSTATVTVSLKDGNGNPVPDKTPVTLLTDAGSVASPSGTTTSGRATFTFTAASSNGTANLTVSEYGFLKETITMGVVSSTGGKPSSIQMSAGSNRIFVKGVGKTENTSVTIQVRDDAGDPIKESALGYGESLNNLRVTLKTHPQGGEIMTGIGRTSSAASSADVETKTSSSSVSAIAVRTTNGSATITLTSGTRPGNVELQVEALDKDGSTVLATAVAQLVAIASGPAHSITLSEALKDGVVNLKDYGRGGVYCRLGSALVTDRYGNAVPDGTAISLNLLDTVLSTGTTGSIASGATLSDTVGVFTTGVTQPSTGLTRSIQAGDQVLIEKLVSAGNRRRFVTVAPTSASAVSVNTAYTESVTGLTYYVGASLHGGAIHGYSGTQGCDPTQLITGVATTVGGVAPIRVTYPASADVIQLGCLTYSGDVYPTTDNTRFPNKSGQLFVVAAVNDANDVSASGSTVVTKGKFCYSAVTPATMTAFPTSFGVGNGQTFNILITDSGSVPIPNVSIGCTAVVTNNASGTLTIGIATTPVITSQSGVAQFTANITRAGAAGATADTGTITCTSQDFVASTTISVTVP